MFIRLVLTTKFKKIPLKNIQTYGAQAVTCRAKNPLRSYSIQFVSQKVAIKYQVNTILLNSHLNILQYCHSFRDRAVCCVLYWVFLICLYILQPGMFARSEQRQANMSDSLLYCNVGFKPWFNYLQNYHPGYIHNDKLLAYLGFYAIFTDKKIYTFKS